MLFGQQASDADGAVLWAAVAERLGRPVVSQAMELTRRRRIAPGEAADGVRLRHDRGAAAGVVAVSDAINEPRYPSLKGIMGAKKKPQDVLSLADLGVDAATSARPARGRRCSRSASPPARGDARKIEDDGSAAAGDRRLPRGEEARLMTTLVFLEHHGDELQKGSLGVLAKGGDARRRRGRRRDRRRGREGARRRGGRVRRREGLGRRGRRGRRAAAAAARRRARAGGARTVATTPCCSRNSVLAADVAAGLAARLDAGLNWDLVDIELADGELVGQAAGAAGFRLRRRRLDGDAAARALPGRVVRRDADRRRGARDRATSAVERGALDGGASSSARTRRSRAARRSRTPT